MSVSAPAITFVRHKSVKQFYYQVYKYLLETKQQACTLPDGTFISRSECQEYLNQ